MHELSIAMNLVELAGEAVRKAGAGQVTALHLRLGVLAGVVREALEFSFEIAAQDTPLAGASLVIETVPLTIFCPACAVEVELPDTQHFRCPRCATPSGRIVHGRELELVALEVADELMTESHETTAD